VILFLCVGRLFSHSCWSSCRLPLDFSSKWYQSRWFR